MSSSNVFRAEAHQKITTLMRKVFASGVFLFILALAGMAQSSQVENVFRVNLRNFGPIIEGDQVKGYYGFYQVGNGRGRDRVFLLKVLDENAQEVSSTRLVRPKSYYLTEAVYNGSAICFSFIDNNQRKAELVSFNMEGAQIGRRVMPKMSNAEWRTTYNYQMVNDEGSSNLTLFPAGNQGFVRLTMVKNRKYGYHLEYFSNQLDGTGRWEAGSDEDADEFEIPEIADVVSPFLISGIAKRPKLLSKKVHYNLQARDLFSGEIIFDQPVYDPQHTLSFLIAKFDPVNSNIVVLGEYFDPRDNIVNGKSQGIYVMKVNMSGEVLSRSLYSWDTDISKFLSVNEKGRLDEGGFVAFHNAFIDNHGQIYFVGERYRKAVSALGVAANVLSAASGNVSSNVASIKMVLEEMMVFTIGSDLELAAVDLFEKKPRDILLPEGWGLYSPKTLAVMMSTYGMFDYQYSQQTEDQSLFLSTYMSIQKERGEPRKNILGVIMKGEDAEFVEDKIDLTSEATSIAVLPGKTGHVLLVEYFKRDKAIKFRLEEFNY